MMTRDGVFYNLDVSDYRVDIGELTFVFSSALHMRKFIDRLNENRDIINYSLNRRFKMKVDASLIADIVLYSKIETRGFLIECKDGKYTCLSEIVCGDMSTSRSK